jgi:CheY-like chemotaxis protein
MTDQVAEYLAAGIDGHVAKPVAVDKLLAALASAPVTANAA